MTLRPAKPTVCAAILALACLAIGGGILSAATLYRTHFTHGGHYYPTGSLGNDLYADFESRTNSRGRTPFAGWHWVWTNYNANVPGVIGWNTNSMLFKNGTLATGASACAPWNIVASPNYGLCRVTMLTRRIGVSAGHYWGQYSLTNPITTTNPVIFLSSSNTLSTNSVQALLGGTIFNYSLLSTSAPVEDRYYFLLSNNVASGIEPMRIASPLTAATNSGPLQAYMPPADSYYPGYTICSHGCVAPHNGFTHTEPEGTEVSWHIGGDSGSSPFIIISNECLYTGGWTYAPASSDLVAAVATINNWAGLDTNSPDNQLRFFPLTNYTTWPYP